MTIGFGFIGASDIAKHKMLAAIRNTPDCEVVSVYSSNLERGRAYAAETQIPHAASSLEDLLANPAVHAVYISTTNELHHAQTLAAAQAGKHVLCEKPLAMSQLEAQTMLDACREAGVVLATNHHLRNAHAHQAMRDLIANGAIGKPIAARVFHAVYLRESLQGWRLDKPEAGGGVVLDIVVHDVDTLRFVLQAEPTEVISLSQQFGMSAGSVEDGSMAVFRFDNGVIAQVHTAFTVPYAGNGFEVHGTDGSLIAKNVMHPAAQPEVLLRTANSEQRLELAANEVYSLGVARFIAAIQGTGKPAASGEDGLWSLASALACLESAHTGQKVAISV
ncbi:1,5-anhydro-D-fructose reductase (1,5-anhydro-D-mannitol-forming) [Thiothrix eikelboomii]|uniref:1,5-anhydro-D-fructose reductase (1,5-anhydro-D-mannitol-forming) n=1 Tax=Thiothrix eikelboomii TaxID=92487 RepID=A0A1T4WEU4_9GAMM|nr:Gfo/Idh/MocA family oxidoreductase [Thiothrix eikelboomii]SKA75824.1 1,5-anhydro-D-fructose reductase (1,5-anhydro-D-mannitol-forming) [Thiothrix eikelboomii]